VTAQVATRRENLRRLIHNLNVLNGELAGKDDDLAQLVDSASRVFHAFASESPNISSAIDELPEALQQTTTTLQRVQVFADILKPSLTKLTPAVSKLDAANRALTPFAKEATPVVRDQIRPFVRDVRPLARDLRKPAADLAAGTPDLTRSFTVLNHLFNMVGFNDNGREGPEKANRSEGYLFWLAWLGHNGPNVFSSASNTGILRPAALQVTCATLKQTVQQEPQLNFLAGLTGALNDQRICAAG
jgi:phospholipid/cholesterol/gamma-HCH transport system substrate-binding protein